MTEIKGSILDLGDRWEVQRRRHLARGMQGVGVFAFGWAAAWSPEHSGCMCSLAQGGGVGRAATWAAASSRCVGRSLR
jgi:hypothetical protein